VTGLEDCGWMSYRFGKLWIYDDSFCVGANGLFVYRKIGEVALLGSQYSGT
jgi:hypothetical protein